MITAHLAAISLLAFSITMGVQVNNSMQVSADILELDRIYTRTILSQQASDAMTSALIKASTGAYYTRKQRVVSSAGTPYFSVCPTAACTTSTPVLLPIGLLNSVSPGQKSAFVSPSFFGTWYPSSETYSAGPYRKISINGVSTTVAAMIVDARTCAEIGDEAPAGAISIYYGSGSSYDYSTTVTVSPTLKAKPKNFCRLTTLTNNGTANVAYFF